MKFTPDYLGVRPAAVQWRALLEEILQQALKLSGAEEGGILVRDERTGQLRVEAYKGPGVAQQHRTISPDPKDSLCAAVAHTRTPKYVPDIPAGAEPFHKLSKSQILSEYATPFMYHSGCIGILNLESSRPSAFSLAQQEAVGEFVNQNADRFHLARIALDSVFLRAQLVAVTNIVFGINSAIKRINDSSVPGAKFDASYLKEVLRVILDHCLDLAEADLGGILLFSPDKSGLVLEVAKGLRPELCEGTIISKESKSVIWICFEGENPQTVNIWDVQAPEYKERFLAYSHGPAIRSELAVPLISTDGPIGVINIESSDPSAFGFEHAIMLERFAQQAALFLTLVRLQVKWHGAVELASYGNISDNLTHRLNNLIGGIHQLSQFIDRDAAASEQIKEDAGSIKHASEDALQVLEDYRGKFEQVKANISLHSELRNILRQCGVHATHQIVERLCAEPLVVDAHLLLLRELFTELITNAIKYTPEGGVIEVSLARGPDIAIVTVADSGQGFPQDRIETLFERGMRGNTSMPGTGYGLWWARQFLDAIGGEITLRNKEPHGAVVTVIMPARAQEESP